jgi:ABC-type dipeptide/oligopeptide/nickel transport system permease component
VSWGRLLLKVGQRLLLALPVLWLVVSLVFLLIHLVPGDPVQQMLGEGAPPANVAAMRHAYGLDLPLGEQYLRYWRGVLHLDLGQSVRLNRPVTQLILQRYPYTAALAVAAILLAVVFSLPAGVASARHRGKWQDHVLGVVSLLGVSFPPFALAPIVIWVFAIYLGWLPVSGAEGPEYIILPALTMGAALSAILTRMIRTSLLEELGQDYIRTARAKGLSERAVLYRHALRNALVPLLTILGLQFGVLLAGAIVTETIFAWPGVGRLTITAISNRDYALAQGCILAAGVTYVLVNLLTDVLYVLVNPRMRV